MAYPLKNPFSLPHALPSLNDEQIKSEDTAVALETSERLHSTSSGEPDAGGGPSLPSAEMTVRQMNPDNSEHDRQLSCSNSFQALSNLQDLEASELAENQILTHVEAAPIEAVKQGLSRSNKKKNPTIVPLSVQTRGMLEKNSEYHSLSS